MSNLEKMFIEDAPQQVNELNNVESLSSYVLELQKLEDEIKMDEERLSQKKAQADKLSQQVIPDIMDSSVPKKSITTLLMLLNSYLKVRSTPG